VNSAWTIDPYQLARELEAHGFDVERGDASLREGGGSLTARKEAGTRGIVVRVDAGGRLQLILTEALADAAADPLDVEGVRLTVTDTTIRRRIFRGTVRNLDQFTAIIASITGNEKSSEPPPV
jgi:hypothetical protein